MRIKGIVLEIDENGAIVVNNEGGYTRIRNKPDLVTGVLVEYTEKDIVYLDKKSKGSFFKGKGKFMYSVASAAIVIFAIGLLGIVTNMSINQTFAYIDVDINPSIELKINKDENIVGIRTLNKDSEKLCEEIDFIGKKADVGVIEIINKSVELGFLDDDTRLVMVAGALKVDGKLTSDKYEEMNSKMSGLIEKIKTSVNNEQQNIQLVAFHTSPVRLKEAHEKSISLGRYSLYSNAESEGIKLALEDAKSLKISELFNLLPTKDYIYFEEEQRQNAVDIKLIKPDSDKGKTYVAEENDKKADKSTLSVKTNKDEANKNDKKDQGQSQGNDKPKEDTYGENLISDNTSYAKNTPEPKVTTMPWDKYSNGQGYPGNNSTTNEASNNNQGNNSNSDTVQNQKPVTTPPAGNNDNNENKNNTNQNNSQGDGKDKNEDTNTNKNQNNKDNNGQSNDNSNNGKKSESKDNVSVIPNTATPALTSKVNTPVLKPTPKSTLNPTPTSKPISTPISTPTSTPISTPTSTPISTPTPTPTSTPKNNPKPQISHKSDKTDQVITPAPLDTTPVKATPTPKNNGSVPNATEKNNGQSNTAPGQEKKDTTIGSSKGNQNKNID